MIPFNNYMEKSIGSKHNLHLTHIDEDVFERGDEGALSSIEYIADLADFVGTGDIKLTTKWDGAPAIFCGTDPADGQFFVGTKNVFNTPQKRYKSVEDIKSSGEPEGKAEKLIVALEELPKIGIPRDTVLQGDFLWGPNDHKYETIDDIRWLTVHPNTIVYAWPPESEIGKEIRNARMGIIFHTTYRGMADLQHYRATFGANVSELKRTRTCWFDDAFIKKDITGLSREEYAEVQSYLVKAMSLVGSFDFIVEVMKTIPSSASGAHLKTYINSNIRTGSYINPETAYDNYIQYLKDYWNNRLIEPATSEASRDRRKVQLYQLLHDVQLYRSAFIDAFQFTDAINKAKLLIINKLNNLNTQVQFVKTKEGFKLTNPEGYVGINIKTGNAVKFVDRQAFSYFNFSDEFIKGWTKA